MPLINEEHVQTSTAWVHGLAEALTEAHAQHIQKKIGQPASRSSNWASSLGHPCELHLTLWRTAGEQARAVSPGLQRIFEEGKKQEDLILRELEDMGVRILERGVSIGAHDTLFRELNIHGKLDAKLDVSGLDAGILEALRGSYPEINWQHKRVVAECKSLSPHLFDSIADYDSLMVHKKHYVRSWAEQMELYLLGHNDEAGLFIFKNKSSGEMRFVPVVLDLATCEALAQKAKRINLAVAQAQSGAALPEPIAWRDDVCAECPFLHLCPNGRVMPAVDVSTDAELIDLLDQRGALLPQHRVFEEVKEAIDQKLEAQEGKELLVGNWQIKWRKVMRPEKLTPAAEYYQKRILPLPGGV